MRELFVQQLEQQLGRALVPHVRHALLTVPRHLFVEQYYQQQGNSLSWDLVQASPEQVYRDEALVTQLDSWGRPSSSTSQPSVMAVQLEALAVEAGQCVLEIGVGTGYNAALLGQLVGCTGQVISIDIDEQLVAQATCHLHRLAFPHVIALVGDGFVGEAAYAPYDRLIATCGFRCIPHTWFEQLKTGGRLIGNWLQPLTSLFLSVEKVDAGNLDGRFLDLEASYMEMHAQNGMPLKQKINWAYYDTQQPIHLPLPHLKTFLQRPAYSLFLQCFFPDMKKRYRSQHDEIKLYLLVEGTAVLVQDESLLIFGDERIGQLIQQSIDLYQQLGQPAITDYHVTFKAQKAVLCIRDRHFDLPLLTS